MKMVEKADARPRGWHPSRVRIPRALVALPVTLILGLTLGGPIAVADPPAPPGSKASPAGKDHRAAQAEEALANVEAIIAGHADRSGSHGPSRDYTLALNELIKLKDALTGADKERAIQILARPGQPGDDYIPGALPHVTCGPEICVHYTETGGNAAKGSDGDPATIPTYITQVLNTLEKINTDYVAAGYRTPKRDGGIGGGTNKVDIYIGNIGNQGLYGFCTSDDPHNPTDPDGNPGTNDPDDYSFWAYCALDNDYAKDEFPTNTPIENMRVTAAHEYFHAVQYAYDAFEDGWILESTATWVEDEMFDDVNDNRYYLPNSPLKAPHIPVDTYGDNFHYGTWIWWRYLTEKFPAKTGKLPKLVLDVWKRLDGAPGGPDRYSTQGLSQVLAGRGTTIKKELQQFFGVNRHPRTYYEEGNAYKASPTALTINYSGAQRKGAYSKPRHMSSNTVKLNPNGLSQRDWKLRLSFDAPDTARGGAFVVIVYKSGGGLSTSLVRLNTNGGGSKTVPFSSANIDHVDVLFVNTSTRFKCWQSNTSPYSCLGTPKDDRLRSEFSGKAFRS
jgi:hypothetical protein